MRLSAEQVNYSPKSDLGRANVASTHFVEQLACTCNITGNIARANEDVESAGVGAAEAASVGEEAREGGEVAAREKRVEEGVEGFERRGGRDGEEGANGE